MIFGPGKVQEPATAAPTAEEAVAGLVRAGLGDPWHLEIRAVRVYDSNFRVNLHKGDDPRVVSSHFVTAEEGRIVGANPPLRVDRT